MITYQEFKIDSREETFRIGKISPIDLLAITTVIDFESLKQTRELYTFCLEHIEVLQGEKWLPVKTKDREVYLPNGIEEDIIAISELTNYICNEVIFKAFQQSSK